MENEALNNDYSCEPGFLQIQNEVMEALSMIRIPGVARQVLDFIIRSTWGYRKKRAELSLAQIMKGTGLKKSHSCLAVRTLLKMNLISRTSVTKKGNGYYATYEFLKNSEKWKPLPKKVTLPKKGIVEGETLPKKVTERPKKGNGALPKNVTIANKDNIAKNNIKEKVMSEPQKIGSDVSPSFPNSLKEKDQQTTEEPNPKEETREGWSLEKKTSPIFLEKQREERLEREGLKRPKREGLTDEEIRLTFGNRIEPEQYRELVRGKTHEEVLKIQVNLMT